MTDVVQNPATTHEHSRTGLSADALRRGVVDHLRYDDPFLVVADYASYVECQDRVSAAWRDIPTWTRMSILNTARSGKSRRTARSGSTATTSGTSGR